MAKNVVAAGGRAGLDALPGVVRAAENDGTPVRRVRLEVVAIEDLGVGRVDAGRPPDDSQSRLVAPVASSTMPGGGIFCRHHVGVVGIQGE